MLEQLLHELVVALVVLVELQNAYDLMEDEQVFLQLFYDFHAFDRVYHVFHLLLNESVYLMDEDFLLHSDIEERAHFSSYQEKPNKDRE